MRVRARVCAVVALVPTLVLETARAGPPYTTDDPEPVPYRHWEVYLATQHLRGREGWAGTAPHVEVNYGLVPEVQLHLITPIAYTAPRGEAAQHGYGDTELGTKVRFVRERPWLPQIGTFVLVEAPTGSSARSLGNGSAQVFLPLWLQKSFGAWTTYGGGGVWLDLGARHQRWWYLGWQAQRRIVEGLSVGAEVFHLTPRGPDDESDTRFNLGAVLDLAAWHHLLFSAGRSISGPTRFQGYLAYLLTLGPTP